MKDGSENAVGGGLVSKLSVMLTSSFTGWTNYMMDLGKLVKDPEAMKKFGKQCAWCR